MRTGDPRGRNNRGIIGVSSSFPPSMGGIIGVSSFFPPPMSEKMNCSENKPPPDSPFTD
jgi:hypothetical protein